MSEPEVFEDHDLGGAFVAPSSKVRLPDGVAKLRKQRRGGEPVGRWCDRRTLCLDCHPVDCTSDDCDLVFPGDVSHGNVGQVCDGCARPMVAGQVAS